MRNAQVFSVSTAALAEIEYQERLLSALASDGAVCCVHRAMRPLVIAEPQQAGIEEEISCE